MPSDTKPVILIVDDVEEIRRSLRRSLEPQYRCLEAGSRKTATEVLSERGKEVDVVLLDVVLPDGNGLDWLVDYAGEDIRRRVITMSGSLEEDKHAYRAGAFLHLRKPFSILSVRAAVDEALVRARPRARATGVAPE